MSRPFAARFLGACPECVGDIDPGQLIRYDDGDRLVHDDCAELRESADWCASDGALTICGTAMREHSRDSDGIKWCFHCHKRHEFFWVVMVPDGLSYYGPTAHMEGVTPDCSDLFPGWYREVDE